MSRVGKQPVTIPSGVKVAIQNRMVQVEGPRGKLQYEFAPGLEVSQADGKLVVKCGSTTKQIRADFGSTRAHLNNMVLGVTQGWKKALELSGVGYTAKLQGQAILLEVGFSHGVTMPLPQGVTCKIEKNQIFLESADKQLVGDFAARIRKVQPPEPYLGKGIAYVGERIRRKAGKAGKK